MSREFKYTSLQSLVEAAQRFETTKLKDTTEDVTNWTPDVLYSGYGPTRPSNNGYKGSKQNRNYP